MRRDGVFFSLFRRNDAVVELHKLSLPYNFSTSDIKLIRENVERRYNDVFYLARYIILEERLAGILSTMDGHARGLK